ncbi:uncharacterized protein A4U43_C07F9730 [Asparagus officinalis]|uniref:CHY-type domain-containing protein n=1 Tax=Asparagus officinalis TaxID=4686 RepID=A0A5P1EB05_ASPOF|nr:uncharacterized protein A4U43_C07F9730 [Asparagus officinalis]
MMSSRARDDELEMADGEGEGESDGEGEGMAECKHYRRRCKIRAPCCNEIFGCRHCHNESTTDRHELCRHDVQKVRS